MIYQVSTRDLLQQPRSFRVWLTLLEYMLQVGECTRAEAVGVMMKADPDMAQKTVRNLLAAGRRDGWFVARARPDDTLELTTLGTLAAAWTLWGERTGLFADAGRDRGGAPPPSAGAPTKPNGVQEVTSEDDDLMEEISDGVFIPLRDEAPHGYWEAGDY